MSGNRAGCYDKCDGLGDGSGTAMQWGDANNAVNYPIVRGEENYCGS